MLTTETAYLKQLTDLDYPFLGPVVGTTTNAKKLRAILADLYLVLDHKFTTDIAWDGSACLTTFTRTGSTIGVTIKDQAAALTLFASGSATHKSTTWGGWVIHEWYDSTHLSSLKLVLNNERLTTSADANYLPDPYTLDQTLTLGQHAVEVRTRRVTVFNVNTFLVDVNGEKIPGANPTQNYTFTDDVRFVAGYNVAIAVNESDPSVPIDPTTPAVIVRPVNSLQLSVVSGSGQGQFPICLDSAENNIVLRSINGVEADALGNVNIEITDCYRWERAVLFDDIPPDTNPRKGFIVPGTLWFWGDCEACSKCQDYADLYKMLRQLYLRAKNIYDRVLAVNNSYNYIVSMLGTVKTYVDQSQGFFRVIQNTGDIFTVHFHLKNGAQAFSAVTLELDQPDGWQLKYVQHNAWEKQPNKRPTQIEASLNISGGLGYSAVRQFPANTNSWWWWSVQLIKVGGTSSISSNSTNGSSSSISSVSVSSEAPPAGSSVSSTADVSHQQTDCETNNYDIAIQGMISAVEVLPGGGTATRIFGPMSRSATVAVTSKA